MQPEAPSEVNHAHRMASQYWEVKQYFHLRVLMSREVSYQNAR